MITTQVLGVAEVVGKLAAGGAACVAGSHAGLAQAGLLVERRAKQIVVAKHIIDTGNLLNSIHTEPGSGYIDIVSGASYSIYNEMGTYKMAARPYMRPALDESKAGVEKLIGAEVVMSLHAVFG